MKCKNCKKKSKGNFCSFCGEKLGAKRIDYSYALQELSDSIIQVNYGFFYTMKELFFKPGVSIRDYINGKRKNHFKPLAYVSLLSVIYILLLKILQKQNFVEKNITGLSNSLEHVIKELKLRSIIDISKLLLGNEEYLVLLFILPIFTLCSFWCFRKFKFNWFEHFVLNSFIAGQQIVIYSFFAILEYFFTNKIETLSIASVFFAMIYNFWVFHQFFKMQKFIFVFLRTIMTYVLYYLFSTIIINVIIYGNFLFFKYIF